jgi:hypothetical protein
MEMTKKIDICYNICYKIYIQHFQLVCFLYYFLSNMVIRSCSQYTNTYMYAKSEYEIWKKTGNFWLVQKQFLTFRPFSLHQNKMKIV